MSLTKKIDFALIIGVQNANTCPKVRTSNHFAHAALFV